MTHTPLIFHKLWLVFLFACPAFIFASHNLGGNFQFTLDNAATNTYTITLWTYTDPAPAGVDRCQASFHIYELNWQGGISLVASIDDIPRINGPLMSSVPSDCTLPTGVPRNGIPTLGTIKKNQYETSFTFPNTGIFLIYYSDLARSGNIINLSNPDNQAFYISAELIVPPSIIPDNPPYFLNDPLYNACRGQFWTQLPGGYDPDGDSLHYELLPVLELLPSSPIPIVASGFRYPDDAAFGNSLFSMDPISGLLTWDTATAIGVYAIHYRMTSYRNGLQLSSIDREDIIIVIDCENHPPTIQGSKNVYAPISDTTTFSYKIWESDSTDSLTVLLNNGQLGNNGPFSNSSLFPPIIDGTWYDGETDSMYSFTSLPLVLVNSPGFPADTAFLKIRWKPKLSTPPSTVQLDLLAHDNLSYFNSPGNTTLTTYFSTTIEIGYWPTNLDEVRANSIHLYPNPTSDILHIESPDNQPLTAVRIYDLQGRLILEKMNPDPVLDISEILDGLYIVEVVIPAGRQRIKLLKN